MRARTKDYLGKDGKGRISYSKVNAGFKQRQVLGSVQSGRMFRKQEVMEMKVLLNSAVWEIFNAEISVEQNRRNNKRTVKLLLYASRVFKGFEPIGNGYFTNRWFNS